MYLGVHPMPLRYKNQQNFDEAKCPILKVYSRKIQNVLIMFLFPTKQSYLLTAKINRDINNSL